MTDEAQMREWEKVMGGKQMDDEERRLLRDVVEAQERADSPPCRARQVGPVMSTPRETIARMIALDWALADDILNALSRAGYAVAAREQLGLYPLAKNGPRDFSSAGQFGGVSRAGEDSAAGDTMKDKTPLHNLTPKLRQCAELLLLGLNNVDIAERMDVLPETVQKYLCLVGEMVGTSNRTATALRLVRYPR